MRDGDFTPGSRSECVDAALSAIPTFQQHRILEQALFAFAGGRDRHAIADELDAYNAAAREVCDAHGVAFVDITEISRDGGGEPAMLADDGLHPSSAQYARWAEAALPVATSLLRSDT